jgi:hypothetical protein
MKIDKKITGYKVNPQATEKPPEPQLTMHEKVPRPEDLNGRTYKIKSPDSALYITINNILIDGVIHPYEIFINSKNMEHYEWVVALTRLISAVFRKGGEVKFLVEELKGVFSPKGGYWKKGKYMPSLVAEIGSVIEEHLKYIGVIEEEAPSEYLLAKREEHSKALGTMCNKCNQMTVVRKDGCDTCLSCGDSKCG